MRTNIINTIFKKTARLVEMLTTKPHYLSLSPKTTENWLLHIVHVFTMMGMHTHVTCAHAHKCIKMKVKVQGLCIEGCKNYLQREIKGPSVTGVLYHIHWLKSQDIEKPLSVTKFDVSPIKSQQKVCALLSRS